MTDVTMRDDGPESLVDAPDSKPVGPLRAWVRRWLPALIISVMLIVLAVLVLWPKIVSTIRAGEEGVLWRRFGGGVVVDTIYLEGTHFIFPWDTMTLYDVRVQRRDVTASVLSADGLVIKADVSIRFRPAAKTVPQLHQNVGPDYVDRVLIPEVLSAVRQVMGQYKPEELYSLRTEDMEREIVARSVVQVRDRYVVVDDVLIQAIRLPEAIEQAIQGKLVKEQQALEYQYKLEIEEQEAQRKRIEARGIYDFQRTVNSSITGAQLRLKGIEATLELARSPNAKIVVIGGGNDGLPLILNMPGLSDALTAPDPSPANSAPPAPPGRATGAGPAGGRGQ